MTNKAYIVANEEQESEVLGKLERWGAKWGRGESKPTDLIPSHVEHTTKLPYALLVENAQISWCDIEALYEFDDILFDGRKEENMSKKYVVSQEFMNELKKWKIDYLGNDIVSDIPYAYVYAADIDNLPSVVCMWWINSDVSAQEDNNRLIAIIRWVNGEDVFEVEKPKKWIVRSKEHDEGGHYQYVKAGKFDMSFNEYHIEHATRFDTKEEAQEWANSHQEVIQVESE